MIERGEDRRKADRRAPRLPVPHPHGLKVKQLVEDIPGEPGGRRLTAEAMHCPDCGSNTNVQNGILACGTLERAPRTTLKLREGTNLIACGGWSVDV